MTALTRDTGAPLDLTGRHGDGEFLEELGQYTLQRLRQLDQNPVAEPTAKKGAPSG